MAKPTLKGKTIVITGASRGIGRETAIRCGRDGANVVVAAKSLEAHPKLPGTILEVAEEVKAAGGNALAVKVDVREEADVQRMIAETLSAFGAVDALINNAGAINVTTTEATPPKRWDLMHATNVRAAFIGSQAALPHLKEAGNPHIVNLSPPISLDPKWLVGHLPYTISKYGMTMLTLGLAAEFAGAGIGVNSIWPRTLIGTAAIQWLMGTQGMRSSRKPAIMADAIYEILITPSRELTGQCLIDEDFLRTRGVFDFTPYAVDPASPLANDLFVD